MKNNGFTLVELLVVIAVASILAVSLGASFLNWQGSYNIEKEVKDIYSDLMDARLRALQRNRSHFVVLETGRYTTYEDDSDGVDKTPDGNGTLEIDTDEEVQQRDVPYGYEISWNGDDDIEFTTRGLSNDAKTICLFSDGDPDYDCIVVSATRINMGKIINQGGACNAANCEAK